MKSLDLHQTRSVYLGQCPNAFGMMSPNCFAIVSASIHGWPLLFAMLQMDDDLEESTTRGHLRRSGGGGGGAGGCVTRIFCNRTGLLVLVAGYALMGALLFKTLEGGLDSPAHSHPAPQIQKSREDCLRELWLITGEFRKYFL